MNKRQLKINSGRMSKIPVYFRSRLGKKSYKTMTSSWLNNEKDKRMSATFLVETSSNDVDCLDL